MSVPIPGSRAEEPDEARVVTLRRQLLAARRELAGLRAALTALPRYESNGDPHPRGIFLRHDEVQHAVGGDR